MKINTLKSFWSLESGLRRLTLGCIVLAVVMLLGLSLSGWRLQRHVENLGSSIAELERSQVTGDRRAPCAGRTLLDDVLMRAAALDPYLTYLGMPLSWFDQRASQNALDAVSTSVIAGILLPALACSLDTRAARLDAGLVNPAKLVLAGITTSSSAYAKTRANLKALAQEVYSLEKNLQRFAGLTAVPAESTAQKLDDLNALFLYVYGAGLSSATAHPGGVIAQSLAHVPYRGIASLSDQSRENRTRQLASYRRQLQLDLLAEVGMGPDLLGKVDPAKRPLLDNTQRWTSWLVWVSQYWVRSDSQSNPCADDAEEVRQLLSPLVTEYGYSKDLLAGDSVFDTAQCYNPSMQVLRAMQLSPYGPLLVGQNQSWIMNPAIAGEMRGLQSLLQQTFMQVPNPQAFACQRLASSWRTADLQQAMNYAADYKRFALSQGLAPLGTPAIVRPLYDRLAVAQLEQVMNDALRTAQVVGSQTFYAPSVDQVTVADQQMLLQSGDFSRSLDPLLGSLRLLRQIGFDASAARAAQCARDFSSIALGKVSSLVGSSRLYEPEAGPSDGLLVSLGPTPVVRDYLARQIARAQVLAGYADPFVNLLHNSDGVNDVQHDNAQTMPYWTNTINEVAAYVQFKNPGKQVGALDTLFLKTIADLTYQNCAKTLAYYVPFEYGNDMFSERRYELLNQLKRRCVGR